MIYSTNKGETMALSHRGTIQCVFSCHLWRSFRLSTSMSGYITTHPLSIKATAKLKKTSELALRASYLAETFGSSPQKMQAFLTSNMHILSMKRDKFYNCSHLLKEYGLTERDFQTYPEVFNSSVSKIKTRMEELDSQGFDVSLAVVTMSERKFNKRITKMIADSKIEQEFENHEVLLTKILNCSPQRAKTAMKGHAWLKNSKLSTLKTNIETIKNYGVTNEAILDRLYVIVFSQDIVENQLLTMKKSGVLFCDYPDIYLSCLHPQNTKFQKSLARILAEKHILQECNCKNKGEYILCRLNGTNEDLKMMLRQFRQLLSVRVPKLKQNFDLLLHTCQLQPVDIVTNAILLGFANSTLRERYDKLQDLGIKVSPVYLKMTKKKFQHFIEQMGEYQN